MPSYFFFYLGIGFILLHEMDAIRCREWRIFPGLSSLDEKIAFPIFLFAHIPLYYILFYYLLKGPNPESLVVGLNYFLIIHFFLHLLLLKHKNNEFTDWISWTIISGAGLCALLSLFME